MASSGSHFNFLALTPYKIMISLIIPTYAHIYILEKSKLKENLNTSLCISEWLSCWCWSNFVVSCYTENRTGIIIPVNYGNKKWILVNPHSLLAIGEDTHCFQKMCQYVSAPRSPSSSLPILINNMRIYSSHINFLFQSLALP